MSHCPKCGSKYETNRFRCATCGSHLVYSPVENKPSLIEKLRAYKSFLILLAVAAVFVIFQAAIVLTAVYWLFIIGILGTVLFYWLRGRNQNSSASSQGRFGGNAPRNLTSSKKAPVNTSKQAKVIPFNKKRPTKSKTKEN